MQLGPLKIENFFLKIAHIFAKNHLWGIFVPVEISHAVKKVVFNQIFANFYKHWFETDIDFEADVDYEEFSRFLGQKLGIRDHALNFSELGLVRLP